jgi:hypothetical protein
MSTLFKIAIIMTLIYATLVLLYLSTTSEIFLRLSLHRI